VLTAKRGSGIGSVLLRHLLTKTDRRAHRNLGRADLACASMKARLSYGVEEEKNLFLGNYGRYRTPVETSVVRVDRCTAHNKGII
jgi:hypothetical protein